MSESEKAPVKTGSCLCGKVQYKLEGEAATPLWNTVCHCLNCRRRSGCAYYTAAICSRNGFTITSGAENLGTYEDTLTDSTKPLWRKWCLTCGSNMFNFTSLAEHVVSISAGTLDDFDEWRPTIEQYCIHRASFVPKVTDVEKRYMEALNGELESEG